MRIGYAVVLLLVVAGCNNSSSGGSGAASTSGGGASSADCVTKMMSFNPGSGDPEKKLFGAMCDSLTGDQRTCIVNAKTADDGKKCMPNKPLQ